MKQRACLIMSLAFIVCCLTCCWPGTFAPAWAAQSSSVSINLANTAGEPGTLVTIPVSLQANGAQVAALSLDIGFDPQIFLNPQVQISPTMAAGTVSDRILFSNVVSTGIFRLAIVPNFQGSSANQQVRAIPDGQVATITFLLSSTARRGTKLTLTNTPSSSSLAGQLLPTVGQGSEITVMSAVAVSEICDGKDNDGDGFIDEGVMNTYYADRDGDGYGNASESIQSCSAPGGYVSNNIDCDDTDQSVHPRTTEIPCNDKDDDCLGGDDTANCSIQQPGECEEDDSGSVDIGGASGAIDREVRVPVRVRYALGSISAFGFDVLYDENALDYTGYEIGDLTASFEMFEVNVIDSGAVRVGGFIDGRSIPQGANGTLVWLKFTVSDGQENECYPLALNELTDDLAPFPASGGCLCVKSSCNGDVNGDGTITPMDALMVFRCYLGSGSCEGCNDVNGDGIVTPYDALCVFKKYLGQPSCLD